MDRFYRGFTAGVAGGIVMNTFSFVSYQFNFTNVRFIDWSAIMIFGSRPDNIIQTIVATLTHLGWAGFLGILLAWLFPVVTSRGYLFKGTFFGFITGFILYGVMVLFSVQHLEFTGTATAASNVIGGTMWGLTAAYVLRLLDSSPRVKT